MRTSRGLTCQPQFLQRVQRWFRFDVGCAHSRSKGAVGRRLSVKFIVNLKKNNNFEMFRGISIKNINENDFHLNFYLSKYSLNDSLFGMKNISMFMIWLHVCMFY